ncbi:MAG: hypothetical protein FWC83_01700 [Alphaproteobacteria bacterium]|nr:hypothetical protein [Alphaproteobacteria bacterium]
MTKNKNPESPPPIVGIGYKIKQSENHNPLVDLLAVPFISKTAQANLDAQMAFNKHKSIYTVEHTEELAWALENFDKHNKEFAAEIKTIPVELPNYDTSIKQLNQSRKVLNITVAFSFSAVAAALLTMYKTDIPPSAYLLASKWFIKIASALLAVRWFSNNKRNKKLVKEARNLAEKLKTPEAQEALKINQQLADVLKQVLAQSEQNYKTLSGKQNEGK